MNYKFGFIPSPPDHKDLMFAHYLNYDKLPAPPEEFGNEDLITDWQMLGNDEYGCCVFAGFAHQVMLWNANRGVNVTFTRENVIDAYLKFTGGEDNGCIVRDALKCFQKIGITDSEGNVHKIKAYVRVDEKDIDEILSALYLFDSIGCGFTVTQHCIPQFESGKPWTIEGNEKSEGGHYVPLVAKRDLLKCITWAKEQQVSYNFFERQFTECWVMFSEEMFDENGCSLEGYHMNELLEDLNKLR